MTQTTNAKSMRNVKLEYITGSTWNDISGVANSLEVSGGDRITGEAYTAESDRPIVLYGKLEPLDVEAKIVYSENSTEAWSVLEPLYVAGTGVKLRWAVGGNATGNYRYVTDTTNVVVGYPGGEVSDGAPILVDLKCKTGAISWAAITSITV
ncbi:MAG TPA: hypothetical protein VL334_24325 [Anaerolineae bacterium]|nr:hypothetical protein [Anaerolineae bacterium]